MKREDFDAAVKAANAFLAQAKPVKWDAGYADSGRETGALKRRSMDLTRALSDLRHPYRQT